MTERSPAPEGILLTTVADHDSWSESDTVAALAGVPAVLALLTAGILASQPAAGAVAVGSAVTVAFGAFKRVRHSTHLAMALAAAGMGASAFTGTLAGQSAVAMLAAVAIWGFVAGLLAVVRSDIGWVGQQCTIVLLVAGAYAGPIEQAVARTILVFGGAAFQFVCLSVVFRLLGRTGANRVTNPATSDVEPGAWSPAIGRAGRLAVVLVVAVELWRWLQLPNGYWLGMTVLLLVRPDMKGTFWRAAERVIGTVAGAILATAITHVFTVGPMSSTAAALAGMAAGLTLMLQPGNSLGARTLVYPGNYAVFAACLTAYVIFLLDYGGLSPRGVAETRVLLTAAGSLLALAVHLPLHWMDHPAAVYKTSEFTTGDLDSAR